MEQTVQRNLNDNTVRISAIYLSLNNSFLQTRDSASDLYSTHHHSLRAVNGPNLRAQKGTVVHSVIAQEAAGSQDRVSRCLENFLCRPRSKWVPYSNQGRMRNRMETNGFCLLYALPGIQWITNWENLYPQKKQLSNVFASLHNEVQTPLILSNSFLYVLTHF